MYRAGLRTAARPVLRNLGSVPARSAPRRFASTNAAPADRPRSWKSSALRWGLAAGALYYYNSSSVFAEEATPQTVAAPALFSDDDLPTVDSVLEEKRKQLQAKRQQAEPAASAPAKSSTPETQPSSPQSVADDASSAASGAGALEEEADQQGAFNPETGEINWDCPCLGGMAHGPCGEEFKTAFSCFVYSNEEPKGMDCIEKFQGMQECFRQYPEIYGAELSDEEDAAAEDSLEPIPATEAIPAPAAPASASAPDTTSEDHQKLREPSPSTSALLSNIGDSQHDPIPSREASDNIPAKWDDATGANDQVREREAAEKENKEN